MYIVYVEECVYERERVCTLCIWKSVCMGVRECVYIVYVEECVYERERVSIVCACVCK